MDGHPKNPELGLWATVQKDSGNFIGRCGLLPWTIDGQQEVEVAYAIARNYWGQGLATEAAGAILQYGFWHLNLPRLVSLIEPENTASQKVAEKIGMRFEKRVDKGEYAPFYVYSISRTSDMRWRREP
jgi:ribosomal-protein-alanine N-acetyltransferase